MRTVIALSLSVFAAGVLPAADPTTKDRAKAKAALALAFAEVTPPAPAAAKPAPAESNAAKAALQAAFGFACDCDPCGTPCPAKCGCTNCGCNDHFPRPMEPAVPPKVTPVEPAPVVVEKPTPKPKAVAYRTEYRTRETGRVVKQCNGNGTCSWVPETVTEAVQVPVAEGGQ